MKKYLAFALTLVLLLSLCVPAYASPLRASAKDAEAQINVIFQNFGFCKQAETDGTWYYAVTDLDHNGHLELLAASVQVSSLFPEVKAWELNADSSALQPCKLELTDGEVFPNILTDSAETRYDKDKDAWFYLVSDFYPVSDTEAYLVKSAVVLKSGELDYGSLAYEHVSGSDSSFMDADNNPITAEAFNTIGDQVFNGKQKSSTNFEWFTESAASQLSAFTDSYAVFTGDKAPSQSFVSAVAYPAGFLAVTKNPTSESHVPGETALFVANANAYTSLQWVFVAPGGTAYSADEFAALFPSASVSGVSGTTLSIGNVSADMSGWSFYCIFSNGSRAVWTNQAWLYVRSEVVLENVDDIFYAWFYDGAWICPDCGNICYGDYCPYCGFNLWNVWYEYYDDDAYVQMIDQYYVVDNSTDDTDAVVVTDDADEPDSNVPDDADISGDNSDVEPLQEENNSEEIEAQDSDDSYAEPESEDAEADYETEDSQYEDGSDVDDVDDDDDVADDDVADDDVADDDDDDDDDYYHHRRKWSQLEEDWDY